MPKSVAKKAAQLSNDFGMIPSLREPYRPNKKIEKFQKMIADSRRGERFNMTHGLGKYGHSIIHIGFML